MTPKITETELHILSNKVAQLISSIDIKEEEITSKNWNANTEAPPVFIDLIELLCLFKIEITTLQLEKLKHRCVYTIDTEETQEVSYGVLGESVFYLQYHAHIFEIVKNLVLEQEIMTVNELERIIYQLEN